MALPTGVVPPAILRKSKQPLQGMVLQHGGCIMSDWLFHVPAIYLYCMYGARYWYPVCTLVDCSAGDASPSPVANRNQRLDFIWCGNTRHTFVSDLHSLLLPL